MSDKPKIDEEIKQEEERAEEAVEEASETVAEQTTDEKIALLEKEKEELKDKWLRSVAEFENFRRRSSAEKANWIKNANQRLILELCDVNDNFERAMEAAESSGDKKDYQKGILMIHQQIANILKREGVEMIETDGKDFDPEYHEALAHIPSELKENKIAATIQNGYIMNGVVIRAARVAVANGEKPAKPENSAKKKKKEKK